MLKPERLVATLAEIRPTDLAAAGVRGLIVDLDNTLVGYGRPAIEPQAAAWVREVREAGLGMVLLSNNTTGRVRLVAGQLGLQGIDCALKPLPHGFRRALGLLGLSADAVRVVGDQLFTDVLGASLAGIRCILVEPLVAHDWPGTRILRSLERLVLPHRRPS